jgi:hypothetical protein
VVVSNGGPNPVTGATVSDIVLPNRFSSFSWTCVGSGGATCTAGPVSGDISDTVDLPVGGAATYTVSAVIAGNFGGELTYSVAVEAPPDTLDANPANNEDEDETQVGGPAAPVPALPGLGIAALVLLLAAVGIRRLG